MIDKKTEKMKILINVETMVTSMAGISGFTYNLATSLKKYYPGNEYTYYYGVFSRKLPKLPRGLKKGGAFGIMAGYVRNLPLARSLYGRYKKLLCGPSMVTPKYDIYFEPNYLPALASLAKKTVTMIFDLSFTRNEWTPKSRFNYFKEHFRKGIDRSDVIVTSSDFVLKEISEKYGISKTEKIRLGVDANIFNRRQSRRNAGFEGMGKYILFVGSMQPRKNIGMLLNAYKMLPQNIRKVYKLLLIGSEGWNNSSELAQIAEMDGDVLVIADVNSGDALADYYRNASLLVFPSLYEGFGLPPLEAMACGCPVVASNASSIPEVCGNAAVYVNPKKAGSIAAGIKKVLSSEKLRKDLVEKGLARVKKYTWKTCADQVMRIFEETLNPRRQVSGKRRGNK